MNKGHEPSFYDQCRVNPHRNILVRWFLHTRPHRRTQPVSRRVRHVYGKRVTLLPQQTVARRHIFFKANALLRIAKKNGQGDEAEERSRAHHSPECPSSTRQPTFRGLVPDMLPRKATWQGLIFFFFLMLNYRPET